MALFGRRNKTYHPVEIYMAGVFACSECGAHNPLDGYEPLALGHCSHCGAANFVPLRIAGYWLMQPLGGGGMGAVYLAWHESDLSRRFAVKILPREQKHAPRLIETLQREFDIVTRLGTHPCIVGAIDSGQEGDELFLVMDYIDGERMDEAIRRLRQMSPRETALIGLRILAGETHLYNQGFLFRDLKPQNVIITENDGAFLFDFGICMTVEEALEDAGDMVQGSPIYFPPERLTGEGETAASEIYSLGMLMYHALEGEPYFTSNEINTIARQHMRSMRLSNAKMRHIPESFAVLINNMICRDQGDRYQNYVDVEQELYRLLKEFPE